MSLTLYPRKIAPVTPKREIHTTVASTLESTSRGSSSQGHPYLFAALRCDRPSQRGDRVSLEKVEKVLIGRSVEANGPRSQEMAISILDTRLSAKHAQLIRAMGRWVLEDLGSKNGTLVNGQPVRRVFLNDGDVFEAGNTFFVFRSSLDPVREEMSLPHTEVFDTLNPTLYREFSKTCQIAPLNVPVLIRGETGTGKELLAKAIHALSQRPGRFVAVNCAAIPETLAPTEFFGYQKGAFSGAVQNREGLIRSADAGTLFLDEIGDLSLPLQSILLRVLQENEVLPVGATVPIPVDIRLCAATHQPIEDWISKGTFRQDLLGRITGHTVTLPPLRYRREDLGILVANILKKLGSPSVTFKRKAARQFFRYEWPQNIRELEKYLQVAVGLANQGVIESEHLPEILRESSSDSARSDSKESSSRSPVVIDDRGNELIRLLTLHKGNITAVAKEMDKERVQIRRWLKHYELDPDRYR